MHPTCGRLICRRGRLSKRSGHRQRYVALYLNEDPQRTVQEELKKAAAEGHAGTEGWQVKKEGSRFWANAITRAARPNQLVNAKLGISARDLEQQENAVLYMAAP